MCALDPQLVRRVCGGQGAEQGLRRRRNISKQVDELKALTPATVTTDAVTKKLDADQKRRQGHLGCPVGPQRRPAQRGRRRQPGVASSVRTIAGEVVTSLSASDAKAGLVAGLQQLAASYKKASHR